MDAPKNRKDNLFVHVQHPVTWHLTLFVLLCFLFNNITLNFELFRDNIECLDYVIVHELCHLIEMNHSKKFWNLVYSFLPNAETQKQRIKEFNDSRTINTDFDTWLSIKINPNTDKDNVDFLRRVRNALLHSNFYLDEETQFLPFAKLKTKSYYESELFNLQFQMFHQMNYHNHGSSFQLFLFAFLDSYYNFLFLTLLLNKYFGWIQSNYQKSDLQLICDR